MLGEVIKINKLDVNLINVVDGTFNDIILKEGEVGQVYTNKINDITKFFHSSDAQIRNQDLTSYYLEIDDQATSSNKSGAQTQVEYDFDVINYFEQVDWFSDNPDGLYRRLKAVDQASNFDVAVNLANGDITHSSTVNIVGDFTFDPGVITLNGYFDLSFEISYDNIEWYNVGKVATLEHWAD